MLESVLRRFSGFDPSERTAELHRKLDRLEAGLQSLEQEIRASGLSAKGIDLSPFQEMRAGLDGVRAGLETAAAHGDSFPGLRKLLAVTNTKVDRLAGRLKEIQEGIRRQRQQG